MSLMNHDGYLALIDFDEESGLLRGEVVNSSSVVTFYGASITELRAEFATSMQVYLDVCKEKEIQPEKPFSGKFMVRIDPDAHRAIALAAARAHLSVNKWVAEALAREAKDQEAG